MYKLGLAAMLVVVEFLLARFTRLDMSRFLSFHSANLSAYEEILAEMAVVETPFNASPPYVQLMVLVLFNTAIFIGSALIQRSFSVDVLPIVCSMTGANPVDAPRSTVPPPSPSPPPSSHPSAAGATGNNNNASDAFATFARTFG